MLRHKIVLGLVMAMGPSCVLGGLAIGCIDLTPITLAPVVVEASPVDDAIASSDTSTDAGADVDLRRPCEICLEGDKDGSVCQFEIDNCNADPVCVQILACAAASGCLELGTAQEVVGCGLPCAADAGLRSQFDPPAQEILGIVACGSKRCVGSCSWAGK